MSVNLIISYYTVFIRGPRLLDRLRELSFLQSTIPSRTGLHVRYRTYVWMPKSERRNGWRTNEFHRRFGYEQIFTEFHQGKTNSINMLLTFIFLSSWTFISQRISTIFYLFKYEEKTATGKKFWPDNEKGVIKKSTWWRTQVHAKWEIMRSNFQLKFKSICLNVFMNGHKNLLLLNIFHVTEFPINLVRLLCCM